MVEKKIDTHLWKEIELNRIEGIEESLELIKKNGLNKLYISALYRDYYYSGYYAFFIEKDIKKAKQCFYLTGRLLEMNVNLFNAQVPPKYNHVLGLLLSDNHDLVQRCGTLKNSDYEAFQQLNNQYVMVIQAIIRDDFDEAKRLILNFKGKLFETDRGFFLALMIGDIKKMEEMIYKVVSPKEHKKRLKAWIYETALSEHGLFYAKLAYIKGFELDIDHPLIPKKLLAVKPNDEYWEYDFMKEGKYKDV